MGRATDLIDKKSMESRLFLHVLKYLVSSDDFYYSKDETIIYGCVLADSDLEDGHPLTRAK